MKEQDVAVFSIALHPIVYSGDQLQYMNINAELILI